MKKIFIGLSALLLIVGAVFFFGAKDLAAQKLDEQIATLQANGFVIEDRQKNGDSEHFVISLADMHKFAKLIPEYEEVLLAEDKSALEAFKMGVDLRTISMGSSLSADIYPVAFPMNDLSQEEKTMIEKYIKEKTLMLHVNYNAVTEQFDGTLKDIDEQIKEVGLHLLGLKFGGTLDEDKIDLQYTLKNFNVTEQISKKPIIKVEGVTSDISYEGSNYYISNGFVTVDSVLVDYEDKIGTTKLSDIDIQVKSDIENDLLTSHAKISTKTINTNFQNEKYRFDTVTFDYGMRNIDLEAFNQLTKVLDQENPNFQSPEVKKSLEKIFAQGIIFDVHRFGVDNIDHNGETLKGFSMQTQIKLDKDPAIVQKLENAPMTALSLLSVESKIAISNELFTLLMQNPRAMMLMMLQPKEENGYKIYDIAMKHSALTINGQPMM